MSLFKCVMFTLFISWDRKLILNYGSVSHMISDWSATVVSVSVYGDLATYLDVHCNVVDLPLSAKLLTVNTLSGQSSTVN